MHVYMFASVYVALKIVSPKHCPIFVHFTLVWALHFFDPHFERQFLTRPFKERL